LENKISIIIPTYNRLEYLKSTLQSFSNQLKKFRSRVELIVCNNASTDGTKNYLNVYSKKNKTISIINYEKYLPVGLSIDRSINNANNNFIIVWGDDDIPFNSLLYTLFEHIDNDPNLDMIHFNRLAGYDKNDRNLKSIFLQDREIGSVKKKFNNISEFASKYFLNTTFISSILFRKNLYEKNSNLNYERYLGYEFIATLYSNLKNKSILYICFPLCIQRKPIKNSWHSKSALYRFVSIPNIISDLEKLNVLEHSNSTWININTFKNFLAIIPQICLDKSFYFKNYKLILNSQNSLIRKIIYFLVLILLSPRLYYFTKRFK
tara:strand:- start:2324 stop:3286 length:963 start_codon:yes stop_codon:yes gene_type:complete